MDRKDQQRPTNSLAPQPVIAIGPVSLLHRLDAHPGMHLVLSLHWHLGLRGLPDLDVKVGSMELWYAMVTIAVILGISRKRGIRLG